MFARKIEITPTVFDGISAVALKEVSVSQKDVIQKKINTRYGEYNLRRVQVPNFVTSSTNNILGLSYEIRNYGQEVCYVVDKDFKIDQKYYDYLLSVIESKWSKELAKLAIDSKIMNFHDIAKIIKEKTGDIVKSWEALETNRSIYDILEFVHVKENVNIVKKLFMFLLEAKDGYISMFTMESLPSLIDGIPVYNSKYNYIDKFEATVCEQRYLCDFDGKTVKMFPEIRDLVNDYEIANYLKVSKILGNEKLIIETDIDTFDKHCTNVGIDYNEGSFSRKKSTASLILRGVENDEIVVNFNLTIEDLKKMFEMVGYKKTGSKKEVMSRLGEVSEDLIKTHKTKLEEVFVSNMLIKYESTYSSHYSSNTKIKIEGIDEHILPYVLYTYIKQRVHGSSLFLKDKENQLFDAKTDFSRNTYCIIIKYMRLDEGIA